MTADSVKIKLSQCCWNSASIL